MKLSRFEIFNWVLFVLFTLFALVQLNDTDSLLWVLQTDKGAERWEDGFLKVLCMISLLKLS